MRNATWAQALGLVLEQVRVLELVQVQVLELDLVLTAKRVIRECPRYCSR